MTPPITGEPSTATAGELRAMYLYARLADDILAGPPTDETSHEAEQLLGAVEDRLGVLARRATFGDAELRQVLALRDDLSGRLLAAAALDAIEMPTGTVREVLRKASTATNVGLTDISRVLGVLVTRD